MKKLVILFLMTIIVSAPFFSDPLIASSEAIIFDLDEKVDLPKNVQFDELKVSKSGQFSEKGFIELVDSLPLNSDQLIIFDLRDECHGLINGMPVCWKDGFNCQCNQTTEEFEYERLEEVLDIGHTWIEEKDQVNQLDLSISQAITERELVENLGHFYLRVPMADGDIPDNLLVDQFVQFIHDVSPNHWVHFHCRTGGEKATTFLVLSEIIKNGREMNLEDILAKHDLISEIGIAKFRSEEERSDRMQQKLDFISEFYAYRKEVSDFNTPWSKWVLQSPFASTRAIKRSQKELNLVDNLRCGYYMEVCAQWDSDGNCIFKEKIEVNDPYGNIYGIEGYQDNRGNTGGRLYHGKDDDRGNRRNR
jgi:Inositol hexakisphosphate